MKGFFKKNKKKNKLSETLNLLSYNYLNNIEHIYLTIISNTATKISTKCVNNLFKKGIAFLLLILTIYAIFNHLLTSTIIEYE